MPTKTRSSPVKSAPTSPIKKSPVKKLNESKVSKKQGEKQTLSAKILSKIVKDADPKSVEAHKSVNAQLIMRGVGKEIKSLGSKPIALVAKNIVKKGLVLKQMKPKVSKKTTERKQVSKAINLEIQRAAGAKPSEVKARWKNAVAKVTVNTEIVKKAVLSQLKKSVSPTTKRIKPTPIKVTSPNTKSAQTSPMKKTPTPKSPTTRSPKDKSPKSPKDKDGPKPGTKSKATSPRKSPRK